MMKTGIRWPTEGPAWKALEAHYPKIRELHLRKLFADDPKPRERHIAEAMGNYFGYSKNRFTDATVCLLQQLTEQSGLWSCSDAMFRGQTINVTEMPTVSHAGPCAQRESIVVPRIEHR